MEGRTPGGSWKKAGGKPGRREGEAEEKREEGGLRDWGLRRGCGSACKTKNNGPSYEDGPLEIKSWRCSTFPRKNAQYHRRWRA